MKRLLNWLRPNSPLRGAAFGFVFGFVAMQTLFIAIAVVRDNQFRSLWFHISAGAFFAVPWVFIWGASGAARSVVTSHPATLSTLAAIAFGIGYSFWEGPRHLHGWLPITVPVYTLSALVPCHIVGLAIAAIIGAVRGRDETA